MSACGRVFLEVEYRSLPEIEQDIERFAFHDEHLKLRENISQYTMQGSEERLLLQRIFVPEGVAANGAGTRYVQAATIRHGQTRSYMKAVTELAAFHQENKLQPITAWALRF
jgi:hypothetical protein